MKRGFGIVYSSVPLNIKYLNVALDDLILRDLGLTKYRGRGLGPAAGRNDFRRGGRQNLIGLRADQAGRPDRAAFPLNGPAARTAVQGEGR